MILAVNAVAVIGGGFWAYSTAEEGAPRAHRARQRGERACQGARRADERADRREDLGRVDARLDDLTHYESMARFLLAAEVRLVMQELLGERGDKLPE